MIGSSLGRYVSGEESRRAHPNGAVRPTAHTAARRLNRTCLNSLDSKSGACNQAANVRAKPYMLL